MHTKIVRGCLYILTTLIFAMFIPGLFWFSTICIGIIGMLLYLSSLYQAKKSNSNLPPTFPPTPSQPKQQFVHKALYHQPIQAEPNIEATNSQQDAQQQIPPKRFVAITPKQPVQTHSYKAFSIQSSYESRETAFIKAARQYRNIQGEPATAVPFMQYWPTYAAMDTVQQRWYFYWRTCWRNGQILETDLSYIFVHAYELINLIEEPAPTRAAEGLWALWEAYREQHPELDRYLPAWAGDILAVHISLDTAKTWWSKAFELRLALGVDLVNWFIQQHVNSHTTMSMPIELWHFIHRYTPDNTFYKKHNQEYQLDNAFQQTTLIAENYWLKHRGHSLLVEYVKTPLKELQYQPLQAAVIGDTPQKIALGNVRDYLDNEFLDMQLLAIMRYAEQALREHYNFRYRLRDVELEPDLARLIDRTLIEPLKHPTPSRFVLDPQRVAVLHQEQAQIETLLYHSPDDMDVEDENPYKTQPLEPLDIEPDQPVLSASHQRILGLIHNGTIKTMADFSQVAEAEHTFANTLLDQINQAILDLIGSPLLFEARDRLEYDQDTWHTLQLVVPEFATDTGPLNPWQQFTANLTSAEQEVCRHVVRYQEIDEQQLLDLAQSYNIMAQVLLDELNEKAFDALGYALLFNDADQWHIETDDIQHLQKSLFEV